MEAESKEKPIHDPEDVSGPTSCRSTIEPVTLGEPLKCCNTSTGRSQSAARGKGTPCVSCLEIPGTWS